MKFRATIEQAGKTATGIEVPPEIVASFPSKRPAVKVTLKSYTYRTTVGSMGGRFLIPVSADVRAAAGVAAGDELDVAIELDTAPREVAVPADLAEALAADSEAKRFFDGLSYSHKRWYVLPIEGAKSADTRQRRLAKALDMMHEGRTA